MTTTESTEATTASPVGVPTQRVPEHDAGGTGASGAPPHRVLRFARAVDEAFDRLGDPAAWAMSPAEQGEALLVLNKLAARLSALNMAVLAAADRNKVGVDSGATSTAAWLGDKTRQTRPRCSVGVRLGAELDTTFTATGTALAQGRINPDQAAVIVAAVNVLTREHEDLPVGIEAKAEAHLLELAARFDAIELRKLGKRLFEVVCPEAADAVEGEKLEQEEERARRIASLSMRDNGDGTVSGSFKIPALHAALLKKALEALTSPRRLGEGRLDPKTGKKLPYPVLLGQGLMELLECHLNPANLPSQGGSRSPWWSPSASTR